MSLKRPNDALNNDPLNNDPLNNHAFDRSLPSRKKLKTGEDNSPVKSNSEVTNENRSAVTCQAEAPQQVTPQSKRQQGGLLPVIKVKVTRDENKGKYVLKIKKEDPADEVNRAEQMAESATELLRQAEIIRGMGEQLLEIFRPPPSPLQSIFGKSFPELKYK
ncbi:hypothetical protein PIB30_065058 [Stylosanthes scabra]|uniref:Uncharacterized protein n=1 Tax=Stylosanthes scabra TaxID=79078 RepID=A0ABU6VKC7_9FABA|nr:hypothetical protein [Stylosanthes scabra]